MLPSVLTRFPRSALRSSDRPFFFRQFGQFPLRFELDGSFLSRYRSRCPEFGFDGLGEIIYRKTYSRQKPNGDGEDWFDTVRRVVEGTFSIQWQHLEERRSRLDFPEMQSAAQRMFELVFSMKFLPSGRGLWSMGTPLIHDRGLHAALNNCAFVSTVDLPAAPCAPFTFLFDCCLLGIGVGYDTAGADRLTVRRPLASTAELFVIPDSREGWVESVRRLLASFLLPEQCNVVFDYSWIRPAGAPIRTLGGTASGAEPLFRLHRQLRQLLSAREGCLLSARLIVDLQNAIGCCVSCSNVRRSAQLALGAPDDEEFLHLKDYARFPERREFGWVSNNSVLARVGMDYRAVAERLLRDGEPGLCWLETMRAYGRLGDAPTQRDRLVMGGNPCLEQSLESYEMCCLVETFPSRHASREEFLETLDAALLYAKTVTLCPAHWPESRRVMQRNRRIGCSVSGVAEFLEARSLEELRRWLDDGYRRLRARDRSLSAAWGVPESIKLTSVKPSGTVSLLTGTTPGMHYPISQHYLRRVQFRSDSPLLAALRRSGFPVEPSRQDAFTSVVSFPQRSALARSAASVPYYEQLSLAAFLQRHWADNQVSCTVSIDARTPVEELVRALDYFQYQLKAVSFLPVGDPPANYPQMPFEAISEEEYLRLRRQLRPLDLSYRRKERQGEGEGEEAVPTELQFCTNEGCH